MAISASASPLKLGQIVLQICGPHKTTQISWIAKVLLFEVREVQFTELNSY
jgi:hypothetical protein